MNEFYKGPTASQRVAYDRLAAKLADYGSPWVTAPLGVQVSTMNALVALGLIDRRSWSGLSQYRLADKKSAPIVDK